MIVNPHLSYPILFHSFDSIERPCFYSNDREYEIN